MAVVQIILKFAWVLVFLTLSVCEWPLAPTQAAKLKPVSCATLPPHKLKSSLSTQVKIFPQHILSSPSQPGAQLTDDEPLVPKSDTKRIN